MTKGARAPFHFILCNFVLLCEIVGRVIYRAIVGSIFARGYN